MTGPHDRAPATIAEAHGLTLELGRLVAELAAGELEAGRLEAAHAMLEGLAVLNPRDATAWCLLAAVERRRGRVLAARLCAEAARKLAPDDPQVRLVRAEALLSNRPERDEGRRELDALAGEENHVGDRARALLAALGPA